MYMAIITDLLKTTILVLMHNKYLKFMPHYFSFFKLNQMGNPSVASRQNYTRQKFYCQEIFASNSLYWNEFARRSDVMKIKDFQDTENQRFSRV